jgi:hypothetical protein
MSANYYDEAFDKWSEYLFDFVMYVYYNKQSGDLINDNNPS